MCVFAFGYEMNAYKFVVGKPEGDSPLVTPRRITKITIKMDLK
jgi:hypothetical protein